MPQDTDQGELTASEPTTTASDEAVVEVLERAGVPPRFRDRRFATFRRRNGATGALRVARALAMQGVVTEGLVLLGSPGAGKTHLAVAILADRAERYLRDYPQPVATDGDDLRLRPPFRSRFVKVPQLLEALRQRITTPGLDDPMAGLSTAPLLILDDLGREKESDWTADRLYLLVDDRYDRRLPTIVTSNFTLEELAGRGYHALVDRVVEDGAVVELTASSYRLIAGRGDE